LLFRQQNSALFRYIGGFKCGIWAEYKKTSPYFNAYLCRSCINTYDLRYMLEEQRLIQGMSRLKPTLNFEIRFLVDFSETETSIGVIFGQHFNKPFLAQE